jgi:hypothetical protein
LADVTLGARPIKQNPPDPARPKEITPMSTAITAGPVRSDDRRFLKLLKFGPFERRPAGGWSFGTKLITDAPVARLIASRRAASDGNRVWLIPQPAPIGAAAPRRRG